MSIVFSGICLVTQDVQRLSSFYQSILHTTADCDDEVHQEIRTNGAALAILKSDQTGQSETKSFSMAFTVEDVDIEYMRICALGILVVEKPTLRPWGAKNMRFLDPDGNSVVFRSFPK